MALTMPDSIVEFFKKFGRKGKKGKHDYCVPTYESSLAQEIQIRETAFHACVNLIANCISKCELKTYKNGKNEKSAEWYRWNVQPNPNMNATEFWQKLVHRLYEDNEALIIPRPNGDLYVADQFVCDNTQAFNPHTYSSILIDGYSYPPVLYEDQVFYFTLHDCNIKLLLDSVTTLYGKLIASFLNNYTKGSGSRGVLSIDQIAESEDEFDDNMNQLLNEDFKKFYNEQNAVLPLFSGYTYNELSHDVSPGFDTRDFNGQIKDIFELYAMAFGIPKVLITGDVQDTSKAVDNLLTFALDPVLEMISDELNRKLFDRERYLTGTYVQWRTNTIRHIDIMDAANSVEKLISSGFCSIDDLRELNGLDRLNTPWSMQYFMTKNFSTVEEVLKSLDIERSG